jgi:environmental stress-induced protein Ves
MAPRQKFRPSAIVRELKATDYRLVKWKNGSGDTREIAVDSQEPFRWRFTSAHVTESGPFSPYPGYDRHILFLTHSEVCLHLKGQASQELQGYEPFTFKGEAQVSSEIAGPLDDINLFLLRPSAKGSLHVARYRGKEEMQLPYQGHEHFVYAAVGRLEYLDPNTNTQGVLEPGDTLWVTRPNDVNLLNLRTCAKGPSAVAVWGLVTLT